MTLAALDSVADILSAEGKVSSLELAWHGLRTLEIEAVVPEGVLKHVVRVVTENCRTLKFKNSGFEDE